MNHVHMCVALEKIGCVGSGWPYKVSARDLRSTDPGLELAKSGRGDAARIILKNNNNGVRWCTERTFMPCWSSSRGQQIYTGVSYVRSTQT